MNRMRIEKAVLGMIGTNVYFIINEDTNETVIVDPADEAGGIIKLCRAEGLQLKGILLTHGHFDHICAADALHEEFNVPVYAYETEKDMLGDPWLNSSAKWTAPATATADHLVKDGDVLELAGFKFHVIYTPGHTSGSCCYYCKEEGVLFSGDTLFRGSYGRTDLPTGSDLDIMRSVRKLLGMLPDSVTVYPGHMEETTIGFEKKYNPLA